MRIACLCPTYGRPQSLIENSIACFLAQTHEDKVLYILDDTPRREVRGGELPSNILLSLLDPRSPSLSDKYNRMVTTLSAAMWFPVPDAVAVWDDDDVYLPWHLEEINRWLDSPFLRDGVIASFEPQWCKPKQVWSTYTGSPQLEDASGRFHGSWAATWHAIQAVGGWPASGRCDYDQQMLAKMTKEFGNPYQMLPSYVFRWADTGASHCQTVPEGDDWYDRVRPQNTDPFVDLRPRFDESTKKIFADLNIPLPELEGVLA